MQRIGHHRRVDHVLDGDDLAQHGVRIVLGVMGGGDLDPGELLAGGAELVHVAHGAHGIHVRRGRRIGELELQIRLVRIAGARRGTGRHAFAARPAGERDQRDVAAAGGDCLGGVPDVHEIGRAAGVGGVDVAQLEVHVVDHRQAPRPGVSPPAQK